MTSISKFQAAKNTSSSKIMQIVNKHGLSLKLNFINHVSAADTDTNMAATRQLANCSSRFCQNFKFIVRRVFSFCLPLILLTNISEKKERNATTTTEYDSGISKRAHIPVCPVTTFTDIIPWILNLTIETICFVMSTYKQQNPKNGQ